MSTSQYTFQILPRVLDHSKFEKVISIQVEVSIYLKYIFKTFNFIYLFLSNNNNIEIHIPLISEFILYDILNYITNKSRSNNAPKQTICNINRI